MALRIGPGRQANRGRRVEEQPLQEASSDAAALQRPDALLDHPLQQEHPQDRRQVLAPVLKGDAQEPLHSGHRSGFGIHNAVYRRLPCYTGDQPSRCVLEASDPSGRAN